MTLHLVTAAQEEDHISSSDDARLYEALVGSGGIVFDHGNKMAASMTDPNTMRIMDGAALLCGRYWNITNYEEVTITNGTPGMNSIALVVANVKTDPSETVTLKVYEGVETEGDPVMPSYIEGNLNAGDTEAEMPLYAVRKTGLSVGDPEQQFEVFLSEKKFRSSIAPNVLWQGDLHMSGSQQANLSSNLNEQMIGIYLCWKEYTDGVATENRTYQFIPKGVPSGCAFDQFLTNRGAGLIGNKQVYVYDDRIVGDDNNSRGEYTASTTNLRMSNNRWVLAEIIGI